MLFNSRKKALVLYCVCIAAGIVLSAGDAARGSIVQIEITGKVTSVDDRAGALGGKIKNGYTFTGWYMYDSGTPDSNPLSTQGDYEHDAEPFGITLNINGLSFASNPEGVDFLITVTNDYDLKDSYLLSSTNNLPLSTGAAVSQISWQLNDYTATALDNDAIPTEAPALADWQRNSISIICGSNGATRITATITDTWTDVPEPASVLIITLGTTLMASRRRRR